MVDAKSVQAQLKRIKFNPNSWGRAEVKELPGILSPDEKIYECVNGTYEGGFALLVATDMRVLLIDKKPLNFLTVEDLRFDMINQIDYNHRLMGAYITINTGFKTLKFTSWNQQRLRKLINHLQDRMSEIKKDQAEHQENQKHHLAAINQQLQAYLLAQHQQLMQYQQQKEQDPHAEFEPPKPSPELADYLFAQSLLQQHHVGGKSEKSETKQRRDTTDRAEPKPEKQPEQSRAEQQSEPAPAAIPAPRAEEPASTDELYAEAYQEVFGKPAAATAPDAPAGIQAGLAHLAGRSFEVNPLTIAYAKLPMMLRNRKFGRPGLREQGQTPEPSITSQPLPQA